MTPFLKRGWPWCKAHLASPLLVVEKSGGKKRWWTTRCRTLLASKITEWNRNLKKIEEQNTATKRFEIKVQKNKGSSSFSEYH
jgi:hypothetical protein